MGTFKLNISFLLILFLTGCSVLQNLSTEDVTKEEYLRRTETLAMTIPEIQQSLYNYGAKCKLMPTLRINPTNPNLAILQTQTMGLTQLNPEIVLMFTQSGKETQIKSYSYDYSFARPGNMDEIFEAIKNPDKCR
jgi:hypothetical protein